MSSAKVSASWVTSVTHFITGYENSIYPSLILYFLRVYLASKLIYLSTTYLDIFLQVITKPKGNIRLRNEQTTSKSWQPLGIALGLENSYVDWFTFVGFSSLFECCFIGVGMLTPAFTMTHAVLWGVAKSVFCQITI